jgi:hypothetical protein
VKSDASIFASNPASLIVVYRYLSSACVLVFGVQERELGKRRTTKKRQKRKRDSRPNHGNGRSRNSTSFITNLDCNILTTLHNNHFDRWELIFIINSESLYYRSEGVFE